MGVKLGHLRTSLGSGSNHSTSGKWPAATCIRGCLRKKVHVAGVGIHGSLTCAGVGLAIFIDVARQQLKLRLLLVLGDVLAGVHLGKNIEAAFLAAESFPFL